MVEEIASIIVLGICLFFIIMCAIELLSIVKQIQREKIQERERRQELSTMNLKAINEWLAKEPYWELAVMQATWMDKQRHGGKSGETQWDRFPSTYVDGTPIRIFGLEDTVIDPNRNTLFWSPVFKVEPLW